MPNSNFFRLSMGQNDNEDEISRLPVRPPLLHLPSNESTISAARTIQVSTCPGSRTSTSSMWSLLRTSNTEKSTPPSTLPTCEGPAAAAADAQPSHTTSNEKKIPAITITETTAVPNSQANEDGNSGTIRDEAGILLVFEGRVLPPYDRGRKAWSCVAAALMFDGVVWGFPLTFGIFQAYYQSTEPFEGNAYIPVVGTLVTGVPYFVSPLLCLAFQKHLATYRTTIAYTSLAICVLSLIASSFSTELWHLMLIQGIIYSLGCQLFFLAMTCMLNEWFVKRRGLAYGVMGCGSALFGLALPFFCRWMLDRWGFRNALRAYGVFIFVTMAPVLPFLVGRLPAAATPKSELRIDPSFAIKPVFIIAAGANLLQGLAYHLPTIFLPSFAQSISISPSTASLLVALLNVTQVLGQVGLGHLGDKLNVFTLLLASSFLSSIAVFLLWGIAPLASSTLGVLIAFSLVYGTVAGGYTALWPRIATRLTRDPMSVVFIYSTFECGRGLGSVIAGPISARLVDSGGMIDASAYGLGKFSSLIILVGSVFLASAFAGLGWFIGRERKGVIGRMRTEVEGWVVDTKS